MNILPTGGHGYPDRCRLLVAWMSFNGSHSILLKRTFGQLQLHDNLGSFRANWGVQRLKSWPRDPRSGT